jgi:hypothetical protein
MLCRWGGVGIENGYKAHTSLESCARSQGAGIHKNFDMKLIEEGLLICFHRQKAIGIVLRV